MNFKKNLIFLSALAICGSAVPFSDCVPFDNICNNYSVAAEENTNAYQWYLEPSIDADELYTYDITTADPYNYFAIVKNGDYYNMIDYNGKSYLEDEKYTDIMGCAASRIGFLPPNVTYVGDVTYVKIDWENENKIIIEYNADGYAHGMPPAFGYTIKDNGIYYFESDDTNDLFPISDSYGYSHDYEYYVVKDLNTNLFGLSDKDCNLILPYNYNYAYYEQDSSIVYFSNDGENWEVFDVQGNKLFDCHSVDSNNKNVIGEYVYGNLYPYEYINEVMTLPFMDTENKIAVYNDNGCAYFDMNGTQITNYGEFEEIRPVHNNLAWVKKDGKWGVIQFGDDNTYTMPEIIKSGQPEETTPPAETTDPETPTETAAWKEAYIEILNTEKSSDLWYSDGFKFDLYDIDSDGIPELFISKGPAVYNGVDIYTFDGENAIKLVNDLYMMGIVGVSKKNNMVASGLYNHGYDAHNYWTKNGNSLDSLCYFNFDEGATETRHWFVNGEEVSVKEYCDSINKYYSDDWVSVGRTYEYSDAESAMNRYIENGYNVDLPNSSYYAKYEFPSKEYIKDMYEYAGVDPSEPEKTQKNWQTAYADFISGKSGKFSLAYIDDDDIPELIHASADRGSGISIYKYSDGEVKSADNCGFADKSTDKAVSYLEKGNSLCITDAKTNGKYYYFYTIENDELKENGNISFDYLNKDFSVNGNSATEDECNAKADEYKVSDMKSIDRENMYDISSENIEKYLSAENNDDGNTDDTDENTNNNNNTNNTNNKNTANNSSKSAGDNKTSAPPDTGDKGTGIALCIAASAAVAAWITRKKD